MWCGTEDSFIGVNKSFSSHLDNLGIKHTFNYSEGNHSWKYWDMYLKNALDFWNSNK